MKGNFAKALPRILAYEGGKVDDPRDPGGRTNRGITQSTFYAYLREKNATDRVVYTITDAEVSDIYKTHYWDAVLGDNLPMGVDLCVFDAAVNSGVGRAIKWLQQSLGDHYTGKVDGLIGLKTVQATEDFGDNDDLIEEFCARRLGTLKQLSTFKVFGKGWSARIANIQKTACSWNDQSPEPSAVDVTGLSGHKKANVEGNLKDAPVSQLATHVTTAAAGAGAVVSQASQQIQAISGLADTFAWAKYAFMALGVLGIILGVVVKVASDAKTAAENGAARATVDIDADSGLPAVAAATPAASLAKVP